jgi:hypothetical protein
MADIEQLIPSILAGQDIKALANAWASAVRQRRSVVLGMCAHASVRRLHSSNSIALTELS